MLLVVSAWISDRRQAMIKRDLVCFPFQFKSIQVNEGTSTEARLDSFLFYTCIIIWLLYISSPHSHFIEVQGSKYLREALSACAPRR